MTLNVESQPLPYSSWQPASELGDGEAALIHFLLFKLISFHVQYIFDVGARRSGVHGCTSPALDPQRFKCSQDSFRLAEGLPRRG